MKACLRIVFCGLFILCLSLPAFAEQSFTVVGRSEIINNNIDDARTNALTHATREVVEKGIGLWVQNHAEVKESVLVREQILTRAQQYVSNYEILKEKAEDNQLVVTIKFDVAVEK